MKRILITLIITLAGISLSAKDYQVRGPQGSLSMKLTLPENFDTQNDSCRLVILMHGIFSSKDFTPMPAIDRELIVVKGENHMITKKLKTVVELVVDFFK